MKKIIHFQILETGNAYLLYDDGSMVECEMEHLSLEVSPTDKKGQPLYDQNDVKLRVIRNILLP